MTDLAPAAPNPTANQTVQPMLRGALASKTMWVSLAMIVASQLAPALPQICLTLGLDADTTREVGSIAGAIMMVLRILTTTSLTTKGTS